MNDQPDTNLDLLADPVADVPQPPPVDNAHVEEGAEQFSEPVLLPELTRAELAVDLTADEMQVVDQHAESGYRPVTGGEIKDYLDAKGMGLEGRPSKSEVAEFLAAKRGT